MNSPTLRLVALTLLAFALGISLGYVVAPSSSAPAPGKYRAPATGTRSPPPLDLSEFDAHRRGGLSGTGGTDPVADRILAIVQHAGFSRREHDLYEFCEGIDASEIQHAMELAARLPATQRWHIHPSLLSRWLDLDPQAAAEWIGKVPEAGYREKLQREMFASLGIKNPTLGLQMLDEYKDLTGSKRGDFRTSLFRTWAERDPAAAAETALQLPESDRFSPLRSVLSRWAERAPLTALDFLQRTGDSSNTSSLNSAIVGSWVEHDSEAAIAYAMALPKDERRSSLREILRWTLENDAAKTREIVDRIPVGRERTSIISELINTNGYNHAAAVAPYVLELPESEQWSAAMSVSHYFPRDDLEGALRWAESLTSERAASGALANICRVWAERDPTAAAQYGRDGGEPLAEALSNSLGNWAAKDPEAAIAFLKTVPDGKSFERALAAVAGNLATTDPQSALASVDSLAHNPQQQLNGRLAVVSNWARKDPRAAVEWIAGSAEPKGGILTSTIIERWARNDAGAAAGWLETLPAGPTRDENVGSFASAVVQDDPAAAIAWAKSISDPNRRQNSLRNVVQNWASNAPTAARAWLEQTTDLDEKTRQQLLSQRQW